MSAVSKEGNESVPTDEVLLAVLRSGRPLATWARMGAADRIEEYCTDAAVAEEALLRCWLATGKTVDDVPTAPANTIEEMAAHVIRFISEEQRRRDALQAKVDALMLEYCPDEMTPEQTNPVPGIK